MSDFEHLEFEKQGATARIMLNRPAAANGMNAGLNRELKQAAQACDRDPEIKVVVLGGHGRFFSAGGDIREMLAHGDDIGPALKALADDLHAAISIFARMQAVLIVAVNGVAAGGGFSLALVGDLVLAAESASFTMAYTKAGLCPDGSSTWMLPRLVGLRRAQELMLTNRRLSAAEAAEIGLVTRVVPDAELQDEVDRLAADLAAGPRLSHAYVKKLLLAGAANDLESQMELEAELLSTCAASRDGREGIRAFVDKRAPEFD
ncbi:MAG TPA: enoyl-CoA hydratase-related protein [Gammaproteobacteria bacterium]|nr:enoyl-CoA hydratase-related protein [Gammaproteobacteria bacterium]